MINDKYFLRAGIINDADHNIIVNYQATPEEEGFTASGALRMGVAEMTRYGMKEEQFQKIAQLIRDVVNEDRSVKQPVSELKKDFSDLKFCFDNYPALDGLMETLHKLI